VTVKLDKLILGANTFEGVSYMSRAQSVHYLEYFAKEDNVAAKRTIFMGFFKKYMQKKTRLYGETMRDVGTYAVLRSI
jgi:hypothetical protein